MDAGQGSVPPICDYEGSRYREEFWGAGRDYEDMAERIALRRLLPAHGRRLLEIGAGFGRLADLYAGFEQVVLLDYSRSLLEEARDRLGHDPRFLFVAGNLYDLPFLPGRFDAVVMVRVIHHVVDVPRALEQVHHVLADDGRFVLEFANKRHLKAIARYLLRRQAANPFSPQPYEFVPLNFDFHPDWMRARWGDAGFRCEARRALSLFRLPALKRAVGAARLARWDGALQGPAALYPLSPSVMVRLRHAGDAPPFAMYPLFRCLNCDNTALETTDGELYCPACGRRWRKEGEIFDFKGQGTEEAL